jgi:hypothetical protein
MRSLDEFPTLNPLLVDQLVFLGVWENPNQDEVWFVGGNLIQCVIARYTAKNNVIQIHLQEEGAPLWWIWGQDDHVWAGGEKGTLLHLDRQMDLWEPEEIQLNEDALDKLIIWGIGGDAQNQWAVGGSVRRGGPKGVILHRSQKVDSSVQWQRVQSNQLPMDDPNDPLVGLNLYKVWADSTGSVWCVGEGGFSALHTGQSIQEWQNLDLITPPTLLFTLHGSSTDQLWTVGGYQNGLLWKWDQNQTRWSPYPLPTLPPLNGVFASTHWLYFVGQQGYIGRLPLDPSKFNSPLPPANLLQTHRILETETMTFHAISSIKDQLWAVGGTLDTFQTGVILTDIQPIPRLEIP